jgi:hypothetical protein
MALRQYTFRPGQQKEDVRATSTGTVTAISGGAGSLGGTVGVVVIFDVAVITNKADANIALELFENLLSEISWPPA